MEDTDAKDGSNDDNDHQGDRDQEVMSSSDVQDSSAEIGRQDLLLTTASPESKGSADPSVKEPISPSHVMSTSSTDHEKNVTSISITSIDVSQSEIVETLITLSDSPKKRKDTDTVKTTIQSDDHRLLKVNPLQISEGSVPIVSGKKQRRNSTNTPDDAKSSGISCADEPNEQNTITFSLKDETTKASVEYERFLQQKGDTSGARHQSAFLSSPYNIFFQFHRRMRQKDEHTNAKTTVGVPSQTKSSLATNDSQQKQQQQQKGSTATATTYSFTLKEVFDFIHDTDGHRSQSCQRDSNTTVSARQIDRDWKTLSVSQKALFHAAYNVEKEKRMKKSQNINKSNSSAQQPANPNRTENAETNNSSISSIEKQKQKLFGKQAVDWERQQLQQIQLQQQQHQVQLQRLYDENRTIQQLESEAMSMEEGQLLPVPQQQPVDLSENLLHRTRIQEEQIRQRMFSIKMQQQQIQHRQYFLSKQRQQTQVNRQLQHLRSLGLQQQNEQHEQQQIAESGTDEELRAGTIAPIAAPYMMSRSASAPKMSSRYSPYYPRSADVSEHVRDESRLKINPIQQRQMLLNHRRRLSSRPQYERSASMGDIYDDGIDDVDTIVTEDATTISSSGVAGVDLGIDTLLPHNTTTMFEEFRRLRQEEAHQRQQLYQDLRRLQQMDESTSSSGTFSTTMSHLNEDPAVATAQRTQLYETELPEPLFARSAGSTASQQDRSTELSRWQLRQRLIAHRQRFSRQNDTSGSVSSQRSQSTMDMNRRGMEADLQAYGEYQGMPHWDNGTNQHISSSQSLYGEINDDTSIGNLSSHVGDYYPRLPVRSVRQGRRLTIQEEQQQQGSMFDSISTDANVPPMVPLSFGRRQTIPLDKPVQYRNSTGAAYMPNSYYGTTHATTSSEKKRNIDNRRRPSSSVRQQGSVQKKSSGDTSMVQDDFDNINRYNTATSTSLQNRHYSASTRSTPTCPLGSDQAEQNQHQYRLIDNSHDHHRSTSTMMSPSYEDRHGTTSHPDNVSYTSRNQSQYTTTIPGDGLQLMDMVDQTFDYARSALGLNTDTSVSLEHQNRVHYQQSSAGSNTRFGKGPSLHNSNRKYNSFVNNTSRGRIIGDGRLDRDMMQYSNTIDMNEPVTPHRYTTFSSFSSPPISPDYGTDVFDDVNQPRRVETAHTKNPIGLQDKAFISPQHMDDISLFSSPDRVTTTTGLGGNSTSALWSMFHDDRQQQPQQQNLQHPTPPVEDDSPTSLLSSPPLSNHSIKED